MSLLPPSHALDHNSSRSCYFSSIQTETLVTVRSPEEGYLLPIETVLSTLIHGAQGAYPRCVAFSLPCSMFRWTEGDGALLL